MRGTTTETTSWRAHAACRGMDPDLFFPLHQATREQETAAAQAVCDTCPVQVQCLDHAVAHNERYGIWGKTTPRERRRLRAQWYAHQEDRQCTA